jgi:sugar/nucleoside kinase (ribokinase family)
MFDVCVVGHITKDLIHIDGKLSREMPGGTAYYTSIALRSLGLRVAVITKVSRADQDLLLSELRSCGIAVCCQDSAETTTFANSYDGGNFEDRVQTVHAIARPFSPDDVGSIDAALFHLGPLTNRDISLDVLQAVSRKGKLVSLDVQGFVREIEHGKVKAVDWPEKTAGLPYVDFLKAGEQEARVVSGEGEVTRAALRLAGYGPVEVVITRGSKGSVILSAGKFFHIPALPARRIVDPTGCGDTYMAGYLYQRLHTGDLYSVGRFAAAVATAKLERFGPWRGNKEEAGAIAAGMSFP